MSDSSLSKPGAPASSASVRAFCSRTQASCLSPVTSSSHRYGSAGVAGMASSLGAFSSACAAAAVAGTPASPAAAASPAARQTCDSRSEEQTSELPALMRTSSAVFCLEKNKKPQKTLKASDNYTSNTTDNEYYH